MSDCLGDDELTYIQDLVERHSGVILNPRQAYLIEAFVSLAAKRRGFAGPAELVGILRGQDEGDLHLDVVDDLTAKDTCFFRDGGPFHVLRETILPELLQRRSGEKNLRIWSAGCSSGQEPYSIAMLIHREFDQLLDWDLQILASDFSGKMLRRVHEARYSQLEVNRGLSRPLLDEFFDKESIYWTLKEDVRKLVAIDALNLVTDWPEMSPMDVIFLRNVLAYFNEETRREVLQRVTRLLRADGYLFLGNAETPVLLGSAFERVPEIAAAAYRLHVPAR